MDSSNNEMNNAFNASAEHAERDDINSSNEEDLVLVEAIDESREEAIVNESNHEELALVEEEDEEEEKEETEFDSDGDLEIENISEEDFVKKAGELMDKNKTSSPKTGNEKKRRTPLEVLFNKRRAIELRRSKIQEEMKKERKSLSLKKRKSPDTRRSQAAILEGKMRAETLSKLRKIEEINDRRITTLERGERLRKEKLRDEADQSGYGSPHFSSDDEDLVAMGIPDDRHQVQHPERGNDHHHDNNDAVTDDDDSNDDNNDSDDDILYVIRNDRFKLLRKKEIYRQKYNAHEFIFTIMFGSGFMGKKWNDVLVQMYYVFEDCISEVTRNLHPEDLIRVYINQNHLEKPVVLHLRPISKFTVNDLMGEIEKCLQSKGEMKLDSSFDVQIATISPPRGAGRTKLTKNNIETKKSVLKIRNNDNLCLARALVVAKSDLDFKLATDQESKKRCLKLRNKISAPRSKFQKSEAEKLQLKAGLPLNHICSLTDIPKFEIALNMQIIVSDESNGYKNLLTFGRNFDQKLYIFFHDNHFDVITKIHSFLSRSYFCDKCLIAYSDKSKHKCNKRNCDMCFTLDCKFETAFECKDCNRVCSSLQCYEKHKKKGFDVKKKCPTPSVCESIYKCLKCDKTFSDKEIPRNDHKCDGRYCKNCKEQVFDNHECFQLSKSPRNISCKYIFFDFECNQESGEHIVNYAVAHKCCKLCIDRILDKENLLCRNCGNREMHFSNAQDFCKWAFSKEHKGYTMIAHNCKSYDGYFLFNYLLSQKIKPNIIFRGGKFLSISVDPLDIRIIDSLNFLPEALSKLPQMFDIPELKKGYFPFLFNTSANQDYEGEIPDASYYLPDQMSTTEREKFYVWYNEKKENNFVFNFKEEMRKYCQSDVDILRRCCLKFRSQMIALTSECDKNEKILAVDPFQYITISSVCMAVFTFKFLKENTIAHLPFTSNENFSKISILWLEWLMNLSNVNGDNSVRIQHGQNSKEYRIGQYKVDGYDEKNKVAYEFHGCFFHGCSSCFPDGSKINPVNNISFGDLRAKTDEKEKHLKEKYNIRVISIWECQFKKQISDNAVLRDFVNNSKIVDRLNPRDAFMGGRTNAIKLKHFCTIDEKIRYVDFCSLYPSVQKYSEFPVGYPTIITKDFESLTNYFGIVKCSIVPPRNLLHPVLPYKCNDSLRFPLCKTCCDDDFQGKCCHDDKDRSLCGTWTTLEVNKAISLGYKIEEIYEVYHFPETSKYDRETGQGGLFTEYINTFLKLKTEASGWPSWVKTEEDKELYIKLYEENEGIKLDPSNIRINKGLRNLAKLMLNSFWGRFGMKGDFNHTEIIFEPSELWQFLGDVTKIVTDFQFFSDECILLEWKNKNAFNPAPKDVNIFIAVFTASHARLKLYEELEKLGDRVLYFDTDSIFYIDDGQGYTPPTGDYLGDLTNELTCKDVNCSLKDCNNDHYIKQFISGGPKNYAFVTDNEFTCCKIRGFTLNYENSQLLNFESLNEILSNYNEEQKEIVTTDCSKICRNKSRAIIYNRIQEKKYKIKYSKRVLLSDYTTEPYGY